MKQSKSCSYQRFDDDMQQSVKRHLEQYCSTQEKVRYILNKADK